MVYWAFLFILGELLGSSFVEVYIKFVIAGVAVLSIAIPIVFYRRKIQIAAQVGYHAMVQRMIIGLGVCACMLGFVVALFFQKKIARLDYEEGTAVSFVGSVIGIEATEYHTFYVLRGNVDGTRTKFLVESQESFDWKMGTRLYGTGCVKKYAIATNPGGFNEKSYRYGAGTFVALQEGVINRYVIPVIPIRQKLFDIRSWCEAGLYDLLSEQNASLAAAMVLGDKANLDKDIKALYQKNGIAHLIAISGLHVAMLGGFLYQLLRKGSGSFLFAAFVGGMFIVGYGMMTGLSTATFRAIAMLLVYIGADLLGRRYDSLSAIAGALVCVLLENPYQIIQVGFLLSFGAVVAIAVIYPIWKGMWKGFPKRLEGLAISISVQLMIMPITLFFFYEIPLYGCILNLVVVPLMSVLLFLLVGSIAIIKIWYDGANFCALLASIIFKCYEWLCAMAQTLPFHLVSVGQPTLGYLILYYCVLALMTGGICYTTNVQKVELKRRYKALIVGGYVCLCLLLFLPSKCKIIMFDVGQGDGIFVVTPHKKYVLVDGGSSSVSNVGTKVLKNGMKYYGCTYLDYAIITHSDADHYSGIVELLSKDEIKIENVILPAIKNPDDAYENIQRLAYEKGCKLYYLAEGDMMEMDSLHFKCLNPKEEIYEDKNTGSIVLKLTIDNFDVLLTGDMDREVEERLLAEQSGELSEVEVLKVSHHGSDTASSEEFLKRIKPQVACVSVAERNHYGHPSKRVMETLQKYAGKIYLTKDCGAITIETDGYHYKVSKYLESKISYEDD